MKKNDKVIIASNRCSKIPLLLAELADNLGCERKVLFTKWEEFLEKCAKEPEYEEKETN